MTNSSEEDLVSMMRECARFMNKTADALSASCIEESSERSRELYGASEMLLQWASFIKSKYG